MYKVFNEHKEDSNFDQWFKDFHDLEKLQLSRDKYAQTTQKESQKQNAQDQSSAMSSQNKSNMASKLPNSTAQEKVIEESSDDEEIGHIVQKLDQVVKRGAVDSDQSYESGSSLSSGDTNLSNDSIINKMKELASE